MRTVVVIPARYGSSRFPGKPLVRLLGKPMVLWVAELSASAVGKENVYVATEDRQIYRTVEDAGFHAVITSEEAITGTDRLAQAVEGLEADIFVNVQGDEPLVAPHDILKIRDAKLQFIDEIVNGYCWVLKEEDVYSVNIPKVITNEKGRLVYMSRLALPGFKDARNAPGRYKKQVCIYAFTYEELRAFHAFGRKSQLEQCEDIEILRFLELGKNVRMIETQTGSLAVDIPDDVPKVEAALAKMHGR